jgi:hypothetical protein
MVMAVVYVLLYSPRKKKKEIIIILQWMNGLMHFEPVSFCKSGRGFVIRCNKTPVVVTTTCKLKLGNLTFVPSIQGKYFTPDLLLVVMPLVFLILLVVLIFFPAPEEPRRRIAGAAAAPEDKGKED